MSRMRKTIATRLKQSQNICASLTTMQEIDMSALMAWRAKYKDEVVETHGVRLGYMGAFTKAATLAAREVPQINASIDTDREIVTYRDYVDISIAVSSPKGLITPVLRNTEATSIVELERQIAALAQKVRFFYTSETTRVADNWTAQARDSKLTMDDLQGGNFSISNPGIFGSMFGTPLINYPQAAVFNMNSIMQRPVVVDGKLEIRPVSVVPKKDSCRRMC